MRRVPPPTTGFAPGHEPGRLLWLAAALAIGLWGCGSHFIDRGWELYSSARYVEAAEVFERTQDRLASADPNDRALYGLYRGLTLMQLGDLSGANEWLTYSQSTAQAFPAALDGESQLVLKQAFVLLGQELRATPPPPKPQRTEMAGHPKEIAPLTPVRR